MIRLIKATQNTSQFISQFISQLLAFEQLLLASVRAHESSMLFCAFQTSDQFVFRRSSFLSRPHWPLLLVLLEPKRLFVGTV